MPKVSVIIPVYNVEKYLGECLDSILGQTLKDIEVLCVDDGSTDCSVKILADYAAKDARVRLFKTAHVGAFRAREVGVKAAAGEFIYFMDADDLLDTIAFDRLYAIAAKENLDQIVFAALVFCEDDVSPRFRSWAKRMTRYYFISPYCCGKVMDGMGLMGELFDKGCFHVSPPLRFIRATVIRGQEYPFPDATTRADNYFTPLSLYYSKRCMAVPDRFYRRRVRNESITTGEEAMRRHARNLLAVLLALYRFPPFRDPLRDPETMLARFAAQLSVAMCGKAWRSGYAERLSLFAEVLSSSSPEETAFLLQVQMTAIRELRWRPKPELKPMLKWIVRCVWNRLCGHRVRTSFIP